MKVKLPKFVRNFYFISGSFFLIWMLFIDSNDLVSQVQLKSKVGELESRKEYYTENIKQVSEQYQQRINDPDLIEKFAREKYFMKKNNEDIFIVVEEKDQ